MTPEDPVGRRMQSIAVRAAQAVPLVAGTAEPGNARTSHAAAGRPTVDEVNRSKEIREFLVSRRARVTPQQAGLPAYGTNRRVAGLRREEVAMLAGVSVDYYTRLERGNLAGASESVLDALVRALQLDEAERAHLFDLARAANTTARRVVARAATGCSTIRCARPTPPGSPSCPRRPKTSTATGTAPPRRARPNPARLHRRTRLPHRGGLGFPGQLGGYPTPSVDEIAVLDEHCFVSPPGIFTDMRPTVPNEDGVLILNAYAVARARVRR